MSMYFINVRNKLSSNTLLLHTLLAGVILVAMLGVTLLSWNDASHDYDVERQESIISTVSETKNIISDRLRSYGLVLSGASGLFVASDNVTQKEWQSYIDNFHIQNNYPGVQGLGFLQLATKNEHPDIVKKLRPNGFPDAKIHPHTSNSNSAILTYFGPKHIPGIGFDMQSSPIFSAAMSRADKNNDISISQKTIFTGTEMPLKGTGFLMLSPVNKSSGKNSNSPNNHITGYVIAPFLAQEFFMTSLKHTSVNDFGLTIYDSSKSDTNLLFRSDNFSSFDNSESTQYTEPLEIFGAKWIFDFRFSPKYVAQTTRNSPLVILLTGVVMSVLLSSLILTMLIARTRALANSKQEEIQFAKDELLSLASHQLRTPATSVKQYIGMVLENFAGKISKNQRTLLEKAYDSNERQLHIINEILYVAKIDAQGIVLTPRNIDVNVLLRGLSNELSPIAKKNHQKLRLQMPRKHVHAELDEHSIRMAIENLMSNALKYSGDGTTTSVKLTATKQDLCITIKDQGVGIDPKDHHLLFQRFTRIPNKLSRQTNGSGIGLYLSQRLIEMHRGKIAVESVKDMGTTFSVTLPRVHTPA